MKNIGLIYIYIGGLIMMIPVFQQAWHDYMESKKPKIYVIEENHYDKDGKIVKSYINHMRDK